MLNRRDVLRLGTTAAASTALASQQVRSAVDSPPIAIIDTNVSLFHWPFRRLPLDETDVLVQKLHSLGVAQAWAASFEGLLHRDISSVNERLVEQCSKHQELVAIGSINPTLPGWQEDLRQCIEDHNMPAVRLHPNYHGYELSDPRFMTLLRQIAEANRFVQIAAAMEDARTQHEHLRAADVDLTPLLTVMPKVPNARLQILNSKPRSPMIDAFAKLPGVFFDTSRVEGTDGVPQLVSQLPAGRVMFGSHAPFLIPEAALIRVHESGQIDDTSLRKVLAENAAALLTRVVS